MPTTIIEKEIVPPIKPAQEPLRMKSWDEAREYIRAHLKPVGFSPAGRPIFDDDEIQGLNILLPDEYE